MGVSGEWCVSTVPPAVTLEVCRPANIAHTQVAADQVGILELIHNTQFLPSIVNLFLLATLVCD